MTDLANPRADGLVEVVGGVKNAINAHVSPIATGSWSGISAESGEQGPGDRLVDQALGEPPRTGRR
jgi:hypothetical protein